MKPEIKAKWLAALRSGEYDKGIGHLNLATPGGKNEFCCLGVLCEVAIKEGAPLTRVPSDRTVYYAPTDPDRHREEGEEDAFLPQVVREWAGVVKGDLTLLVPQGVGGGLRRVEVSTVNDDEGFEDFPPIADMIERYLFEENDPFGPDTE